MNIKELWKNHKKEILIGSVIVGTGIGVGIGVTKYIKSGMVDLTGLKVIAWDPADGIGVGIERVKEFLEANQGNTSKYCIFREGLNPNQYNIIALVDVTNPPV